MTLLHQKTLTNSERLAFAKRLEKLAEDLAEFADAETERLDFETYAALSEYETRLLAFRKLITAADQSRLIEQELDRAGQFLADLAS